VELGCCPKSGKLFDPSGCSEDELQVLSHLQRQGYVAKIAGHHGNLFRYQFTSLGATLVEASLGWAGGGRLASSSSSTCMTRMSP
jgi:hypothetical protein